MSHAKQFSHLDLVHIGPDDWMSEPALHSKKPWRAVLARRRWRSGYNAGGGPSHIGECTVKREGGEKCPQVISYILGSFFSRSDNRLLLRVTVLSLSLSRSDYQWS